MTPKEKVGKGKDKRVFISREEITAEGWKLISAVAENGQIYRTPGGQMRFLHYPNTTHR